MKSIITSPKYMYYARVIMLYLDVVASSLNLFDVDAQYMTHKMLHFFTIKDLQNPYPHYGDIGINTGHSNFFLHYV